MGRMEIAASTVLENSKLPKRLEGVELRLDLLTKNSRAAEELTEKYYRELEDLRIKFVEEFPVVEEDELDEE